jgi:predicted Zn-dependent peptidase
MVQQFHDRNYVGENIYIVAAEDINHEELVAAIESSFRVPKTGVPTKYVKPIFGPGLSTLDAEDLDNTNMAILHKAPSLFDHDFLTYELFERVVEDKPENINNLDFLQSQKGCFISCSDTGLYGNYFKCNP